MSARSSLSPECRPGTQEQLPSLPMDYQHLGRAKRTSLAQIAVPSFSAFRDRASSIPVSSPVRRNYWRKPLPEHASPRPVSYSYGPSPALYDASAARTAAGTRPYSIASPLPQQSTGLSSVLSPPLTADYQASKASQHSYDRTPSITHDRAVSIDSRLIRKEVGAKRLSAVPAPARPSSIPVPLRYGDKNDACLQHVAKSSASSVSSAAPTSNPASSPSSHRRSRSSLMSSQSPIMTSRSPIQPPAMTVQLEGIDRIPRSFTDESFASSDSSSPAKRRSNSPGGKFTSFFGWKSSPQLGQGNSPTTTFSDHSASPLPSPSLQKVDTLDASSSRMGLTPPPLDPRGFGQPQAQYFDLPGSPLLSGSVTINAHVEELERELRQISSELAGSIRRELDLEDEVDRFRAEVSSFTQDHPQEKENRRTSDYYSDSGASSLRFPLSDSDSKIEELEKMRRKAEQDKAQMQVEYAQRLAQELRQRKELEEQLHAIEQELQSRQDTLLEEPNTDERVRELETYLDDTRRRLSQERQAKDNFEDMFAALREENKQHRNEAENLREEVLPQLRARIEGLEAEASELRSSQYEHARMQQEIQSLLAKNKSLQEAQNNSASINSTTDASEMQREIQSLRAENRLLQEVQNNSARFNSIAEDGEMPTSKWARAGLTRSNSLARSSSHGNLKRGGSLSRSGSVKEAREARPRSDSVSGERLKDVEEQRDALHKALKNLLRRFEGQKKEHSKTMRRLVADRDRARNVTPARTGYSREVQFLREEIGMLRRRADDALEHKWQAENNIGGVKMALDRAEQETRSLREYLAGRHSGLIRSPPRIRSQIGGLGISLAGEAGEADEPELGEQERQAMIKVLRQSIQLAEHERDSALREAEAYRERARSLQSSDNEQVDKEQELANELLAAASRMEQLAAQVQTHLQSNMELRQRLTDAVTKGEKQQCEATARITDMQSRLKNMEDNVMQAQQQSEAAFVDHEEDAKRLDEANSPQLSRLHAEFPAMKTPSPMLAQGMFAKSPKLAQNGSSTAENLFEATKTATLERRVRELEAALSDADSEMKEVVERINNSQYEIAELQGERDDAQKRMRKLQREIADEKEKASQLMSPII
ncbi:hypothetical protein BDV97DRAFT_20892 [Delphinella strobiligena]|nr:hypothetical protein BDV97DRAFT_20892 [Delphinella strobiligena]